MDGLGLPGRPFTGRWLLDDDHVHHVYYVSRRTRRADGHRDRAVSAVAADLKGYASRIRARSIAALTTRDDERKRHDALPRAPECAKTSALS